MRVHIGMTVFFVVLSAFLAYPSQCLYQDIAQPSFVQNFGQAISGFGPFIILHTVLAVGAWKKSELSKKVSEIVFAIMCLGFLVGTFSTAFLFAKNGMGAKILSWFNCER